MMRIVVVDDDRASLLVLGRMTTQAFDSEITTHLCPSEALADIVGNGCNLVLLDYTMRQMDGIAFTRRLRATAAGANIPLVLVTSDYDGAVWESAVDAGVTEFITKPINPCELKTRLRNLLSTRHASPAAISHATQSAKA